MCLNFVYVRTVYTPMQVECNMVLQLTLASNHSACCSLLLAHTELCVMLQTPEVPIEHLRISRARLRDTLVQHFPPDQMTFGAACMDAHTSTDGQGPVEVHFQVWQCVNLYKC